MDQVIIKTLLILAFAFFAFLLFRGGSSARSQAARTIVLLILFAGAVVAVLSPRLIDWLAHAVGVGRGADLLLYGFILVFIGASLNGARKRRAQDKQITELARKMALSEPLYPEK